MKKLIFAAAIAISTLSVKVADAQVNFNLSLNIGSQPDWGPVGYNHAEYYYFPEIDAYYNVPAHQYVYFDRNAWVRANTLPSRYRNFNVYNSYKVVINDRDPWRNASAVRAKYARYSNVHNQVIIRDSRDSKYRNHWKNDDRNRYNNGRPDFARNNRGYDRDNDRDFRRGGRR